MTKPRITIIGLGFIGGSIGLALRQAQDDFEVVGHDREPQVAGQARKLGAVDRTDWNLISACEKADLIIIATPLMGVKQTLEAIAPYLKKGCLITDTASLKGPVLDWADQFLPPEVHFVGGNPIVVTSSMGLETARDDLFAGNLYCLIPSPKAAPQAVQLATDLVHLLGARPYFLDAAEHDGLMAGVDQLPSILSITLLRTVTGSASWREMRRLAGSVFEKATCSGSNDPTTYRDACLLNRQNMVRWIDSYQADLNQLKEWLTTGDEEKLLEVFEEGLAARQKWLLAREEGHWDLEEMPELSPQTGFLKRFIGLG